VWNVVVLDAQPLNVAVAAAGRCMLNVLILRFKMEDTLSVKGKENSGVSTSDGRRF
jgi:hypothetical protein